MNQFMKICYNLGFRSIFCNNCIISTMKHQEVNPTDAFAHHKHLHDLDKHFLRNLSVDHLTKNLKTMLLIVGKNKTGKSLSCNEIIDFKLIAHQRQQQQNPDKGLFPAGSNEMTSFSTFYSFSDGLQSEKIAYELIDTSELMENKSFSESHTVNYQTLNQIEKKHRQHREKLRQLDKKTQQINLYFGDQNSINETEKLNGQLNTLTKKCLLIKGNYKLFNRQDQKQLNKYVLICDTVGTNDHANQEKKKQEQVCSSSSENQFIQQSQQSIYSNYRYYQDSWESESENIGILNELSKENQFNCIIICFDLTSGFDQDCSKDIKQIYRVCPNPQNVTISFNLANYLKIAQGKTYYSNINDFLEHFLRKIPQKLGQLIEQFIKDQLCRRQNYNQYDTNSLKTQQLRHKKNYLQQIQNNIKQFQNTVKNLIDQQQGANDPNQYDKLIRKIKVDKKIPDKLLANFPFHVIKFHGKPFINSLSSNPIVLSIYNKANEIFKEKIKDNIKACISQKWEKIKQNSFQKLTEIRHRYIGRKEREELKKKLLKENDQNIDSKQRLEGLKKFEDEKIIPIVQMVKNEFQQILKKKRELDKQTSTELDVWIKSRTTPKQKNWYLWTSTVKADYQKKITNILKLNAENTLKVFEDFTKKMQSFQGRQQMISVQTTISSQNSQEIKQQLKTSLKLHLEDLSVYIHDASTQQLLTHNHIMTAIQQEAQLFQLKVYIQRIDVSGIISSVTESIIQIFGPSFGILLGVGRILGIIFTGVAMATAIPLTVASLVYYPVKSYFSRSTDQELIKNWNRYLNFFRTIKNKLDNNSQREIPEKEFQSYWEAPLILQEIQQQIEVLDEQTAEFTRSCQSFKDQIWSQKSTH